MIVPLADLCVQLALYRGIVRVGSVDAAPGATRPQGGPGPSPPSFLRGYQALEAGNQFGEALVRSAAPC